MSIGSVTVAERREPSPRLAAFRKSLDRQCPVIIARIFLVGAALSMLHAVFRGTRWLDFLVELFGALVFSLGTAGFATAALLIIVGYGLMRRKRLAWLVAVAWLALLWAGSILFTILWIVYRRSSPLGTYRTSDVITSIFNIFTILVLIAGLVMARKAFTARTAAANWFPALGVFLAGLIGTLSLITLIALVLPTTGDVSAWNRITSIFQQLLDIAPIDPVMRVPRSLLEVAELLIAASAFAALAALLRSQRSIASMPLGDEAVIRRLLSANSEDSLGYFATRRDKSAVFAPNGQAAVAYRVQLGTCLASGDPVGDRDSWRPAIDTWLSHTRSFGWTPGVVGASEHAAEAYVAAGLRALKVGDEAILEASRFDLQSPALKRVAQTVRRLEHSGHEVRIRRHRDIPEGELRALIAMTHAWRDTVEERGFSMALGRLGDPLDGDCVMVEAIRSADDGDEVVGILSFVPWGADGLSLDVMRRNPNAENGVVELMVSRLMQAGSEVGARRVSLNFAVFRTVLEDGSRVGASLVLRIERRILMAASRWWQIDQLYRSNVKFDPSWQPRFMCYDEPAELGTVSLAMGVAEGFIDFPGWLVPQPAAQQLVDLEAHPELVALTRPQIVTLPEPELSDQMKFRRATRSALLNDGVEPYPAGFEVKNALSEIDGAEPDSQLTVAGRIVAVSDHGGVIFVRLQDWRGAGQMILERDSLGETTLRRFRSRMSLGDHCGFTGRRGQSRNGTASLLISDWMLTSKALRPLPDAHAGFSDPQAKVRKRYLDLIVNPDARDRLRQRSLALRSVRGTLQQRGYLEVETPMLQGIHGGANARPFRTHINAYNMELYLRIAPELYLKRLMVGGMDRVFEIGHNFRNEGADATHNPEFTMLEAYEAYGDYTTMRHTAQQIIVDAAQAAMGGTVVRGSTACGEVQEVDLAGDWRVVTVNDALSEASGSHVTADTTHEELVDLADALGIAVNPTWTRGNVLLELYEHLVEHCTVAPTFYCDFPAEVSPLTRQHRHDDRLAERWDLVAFGVELGTAYSELVDPVVQRARLTAQSLQAAGGDPEAMEIDEDFLTALEYGMPPSGGLGMGMDRLVMMLTNASIRETIAFPLVRPGTSTVARRG